MKKILVGITLLMSSISFAQSITPEVTAAAGAHFAIPSIQMSWTLGETVTESITDGTTHFTQGFQQSNISLVGISDFDFTYTVNAFPNPTIDVVRIQLSENSAEGKLNIIGPTGKILLERAITESDFLLDFATYAQGTYFLNLMNQSGTILHTIKLQKLN